MLKGYNDLRTTHPKIAREWNKGRNGDLKPTDAIASSNKRVWWKCKECHEWFGLIANRARKGKAVFSTVSVDKIGVMISTK